MTQAHVSPRRKLKRWPLGDFSQGMGGLLWTPGTYYAANGLDTRTPGFAFAGPGGKVDFTGIAANEKPVKKIQVGADVWLATSTTVYRSTAGSGNWVEKGANGTLWTVGNPTDIVAFSLSGGQPIIAVAMGNAVAFQYTLDNGANWIASTRAGSAKYANYFCVCSKAGNAPVVRYLTNPNLLYSSPDLQNGSTINTDSTVGDSINQFFTSAMEDLNGVFLMGKNTALYSMDSLGQVYQLSKTYTYKAVSELGTFTGYPTRPGNFNFENPVQIGPYLYYIVEEYRCLEWGPSGLTEGIEPSNWAEALRLRLPITAMCAVGNELWVALSNPFPVVLDTTRWPGATYLLGNAPNAASTSQVYAGQRQPDGTWRWHGYLISSDYIRYLWYNDSQQELVYCMASQPLANFAQYRADVPLVTNLGRARKSGFSTPTWRVETGLFLGEDGSATLKRPIRGRGGMKVATTGVGVSYRTGRDDEAAGYTTLDTHTLGYRAEEGTKFPPGTTFRQMRVMLEAPLGGVSANTDDAVLYHYEVEYEE